IIDRPFPLRFNNQKSIGHQSSKDETLLLATGRTYFRELALQLRKRHWLKFIELLENAHDRGRGVRIHAQFLALVSLFGERFLSRNHGGYKAGRTRNYEDRQ